MEAKQYFFLPDPYRNIRYLATTIQFKKKQSFDLKNPHSTAVATLQLHNSVHVGFFESESKAEVWRSEIQQEGLCLK